MRPCAAHFITRANLRQRVLNMDKGLINQSILTKSVLTIHGGVITICSIDPTY
jgi:hypothetical protein